MLRERNRVRFQTEQTSGSEVVEKVFEEALFVSRCVIMPNKMEISVLRTRNRARFQTEHASSSVVFE